MRCLLKSCKLRAGVCRIFLNLVVLLASSGAALAQANLATLPWPQWRGPLANGVSPNAHPPVHWSETNNLWWKFLLPGKGHSSPIIVGERVLVLAAVPTGCSIPAQALGLDRYDTPRWGLVTVSTIQTGEFIFPFHGKARLWRRPTSVWRWPQRCQESQRLLRFSGRRSNEA